MSIETRLNERATKARLLEGRIAENAAAQEIDFLGWIFEKVKVKSGDTVLEIGCGSGAQTVGFVERVGDTGHVVAVDVSRDALATLRTKVDPNQLNRLTLIEANMDELESALEYIEQEFQDYDTVFCAYALYYSADARKVLEAAKRRLKPGGRIVIVGPFGPNNKPLFDLLKDCGVTISSYVMYTSAEFMNDLVLEWGAVNFGYLKISTIRNRIHWNAPDRILNYWKNSTFFEPDKLATVQEQAEQHFRNEAEFTNDKWIMLVEMYDART